MQSSTIEDIFKKCNPEKLERLVFENKEMHDASLDALRYKGNVLEYLKSLPKDEILKILGKLLEEQREKLEEYHEDQQDRENIDATDRSHHGCNNSKVLSTEDKKVKKEGCFGSQDQPAPNVKNDCPQDLKKQVASITDHNCPNDPKVVLTTEKEEKVQDKYCFGCQGPPAPNVENACSPQDLENQDETDTDDNDPNDPKVVSTTQKEVQEEEHFGSQVQPAGTDVSVKDHHGRNIKDGLLTHPDVSKGQIEQSRKIQPWEFPLSQEPKASTQQRDSEDQQLPVAPLLPQLDHPGSLRSSSERLAESGEEGSSVASGSTSGNSDKQQHVQALADDNRNILRAMEHGQTLGTKSSSELHNSHQRPDAHLPETSNLQQIQTLQLLVDRLSETLRNNSEVALVQANREGQNIQGTSCSNCDVLREEIDDLQDQKMNVEQDLQQLQHQIAADEESLRNQEYKIRGLRQCFDQLQYQIAAHEETIHAQNEERKGDKKIIDCLVKKIKKLQDELNMTNKRAYEFAENREEDFDDFLKMAKDITKAIEEIQKKLIAEKEENKILKEKLKEKWKEKELDEQGLSSRQGDIGHAYQQRALRALQQRLSLCFLADDAQENNLNPEQHDGDDDID